MINVKTNSVVMNKWLVILIVVFVLLSFVSLFLEDERIISMVSYSLTLAWLVALMMMMANGTFMDKPYYKLMYPIVGCIIIGAMFKIMHWSYADQILLVSLLAIQVLYAFHFVKKERKDILDVLKLLSVVTHFSLSILIIRHVLPEEYRELNVSACIFWFTFVYFIVDGIRNKKLFTSS